MTALIGQEEWPLVAQEMASVIEAILDEFADMCRRSDHHERAIGALRRYREFMRLSNGF